MSTINLTSDQNEKYNLQSKYSSKILGYLTRSLKFSHIIKNYNFFGICINNKSKFNKIIIIFLAQTKTKVTKSLRTMIAVVWIV
jgi:hypothetical protein